MDIVIPYGGNSESIKYALRSIEKNFDYSNIFIVTDHSCPHLNHDKLNFVKMGDMSRTNKDANLFDKVLAACRGGVAEEFMFWSDDQVSLREHEISYVYNVRNPTIMAPTCKWESRLVRTGLFVRDILRRNMPFNFDSHVPQLMKRDEFLKIEGLDYYSGLGFTICTLYFGIAGWFDRPLVEQRAVKATFEAGHFNRNEIVDKDWMGWDAVTYNQTKIKELLENLFPKKSIFEK